MHSAAVRSAIHVAAILAIYLSFAMLAPAAVDLYYGHDDWQAFAFSAFFLGGLSFAVMLATRGKPPPNSPRFAFLLVNMMWLTTAAAGAVPFLVTTSIDLDLADAVFEAVSGITTTGGTVITGLDDAPPGLLLWRSLLQFMGGLGVIALGLFLLPFLNIGGFTYFRIESSDISDRPFERFTTFSTSLIGIYSILVLICAVTYAAFGMETFDAINHAMTTVSTGGFSTHDTSYARYAGNAGIMWTGIFFMFLGALPFSIVILFVLRGRLDALRDPQIRVFAAYVFVFSVAVGIYLRLSTGVAFVDALTAGSFNVVSIITTTGLTSADYSLWGPFAVACAFVATFLGGCSGSTSGGIKAYRFLILFELMANGVRRLVYPNTIHPVRYGDRSVNDDMQRAVVLFVASFFIIWMIGTILLAATGLDLITSISGSLTSLTNVGPGLGETIGPAGNFSAVPDAAKWVMSLLMLLGRLEILAVLVVLSPSFWLR